MVTELGLGGALITGSQRHFIFSLSPLSRPKVLEISRFFLPRWAAMGIRVLPLQLRAFTELDHWLEEHQQHHVYHYHQYILKRIDPMTPDVIVLPHSPLLRSAAKAYASALEIANCIGNLHIAPTFQIPPELLLVNSTIRAAPPGCNLEIRPDFAFVLMPLRHALKDSMASMTDDLNSGPQLVA